MFTAEFEILLRICKLIGLIEKLNSSGGQVLLEVSFAKCATEVSLAKNPPGP